MNNLNVREWHDKYELLEGAAQNAPGSEYDTQYQVINAAYKAARYEIECTGLSAANDDRAEELIAAITKYVLESQPSAVQS